MTVVTPLARKNDSDPRDNLRTVAARMREAQTAVGDKDAALDRARRFVREIEARVQEAATEVNTAKEEHAARVADSIGLGEKPPAATAVKAARVAEVDLQDQLEAARSSIDK